ncbi:uncharacterized protein EKO05_0009263 [Ascochyta rabiei]|uniref:uncharacterized protein n=1 Tax=Didymella rabiei TaxID=5454 RepID=UPI001901F7E5|nr:uncharacterized protein EKO05_0009263 [Ascochyta rabiei]UPX18983.1 hypothetical protein EKO05_0009263 [Ascochyta rabiei]
MSLLSVSRWPTDDAGIPEIDGAESFADLVDKLSQYFDRTIKLPHTFEDFRTSQHGRALHPLITHLSNQVHHPALVSALLALKGHFDALEESSDEPGVYQARGYACEFVAWQFLNSLTDRDVIDFLLLELPSAPYSDSESASSAVDHCHQNGHSAARSGERTPLLDIADGDYFGTRSDDAANPRFGSLKSRCENLSALEIAAVGGAKKFLSQRPIQKVINGLWRGDIVFWETLSVNSVKRPRKYNRKQADPFSRLRVPRYLKIFETLFFAIFLALYYAVLVRRDQDKVTVPEIMLYLWIASFAYDEFADYFDAGQTSFYVSDFWWTWDISIVVVAMAFCTLRIVGLTNGDKDTIDLAYDVLGLEALFLVPRIFSLLSLNPYFGTLIPCLKEMTKDFVKFLSLVLILYLGFLTTFVLLARDHFKPQEMSWILIKVFFGSSYLGFDVAQEISPFFGPPVMLIFIILTNILLITSLISLLSNSLSKILEHARDEYLFIYSVYVLEASSSNRLTYFLPPLNLIPLCTRPFRLILPSEQLRSARIVLLKATHLPFVGIIWAYEQLDVYRKRDVGLMSFSGPQTPTVTKRPPRLAVNSPRLLRADTQATSSTAGRAQFTGLPQSETGLADPDAQLRTLVINLTTQVDALTAIVCQLQEQREASEVA